MLTQLELFQQKTRMYVSPMDVHQNPDKYELIDVRHESTDEYPVLDKIKTAYHMDLIMLADHPDIVDELPTDKIFVLCGWDASCTLAAKAAVVLLQLNPALTVVELSGGIAAWKHMNFPVESEE